MLRAPQTQAEADKQVYNSRASNPKGIRYDAQRCAYEVWERHRGAQAWQCRRKRGHGPDKLYCKIHAKKVMLNVAVRAAGVTS